MLEGRNRVHDLRQLTQASADLPEALEALAGRFGVKLETEAEDPDAASRREVRARARDGVRI